jgi:hypothetical protein
MFFRVGLHLDSSFGCSFDGLAIRHNYIGIDADPTIVEGKDSGYVTILTINNYTIVNNKKHAIYKESQTTINGGVRICFNDGYLESNGDDVNAQIKYKELGEL